VCVCVCVCERERERERRVTGKLRKVRLTRRTLILYAAISVDKSLDLCSGF